MAFLSAGEQLRCGISVPYSSSFSQESGEEECSALSSISTQVEPVSDAYSGVLGEFKGQIDQVMSGVQSRCVASFPHDSTELLTAAVNNFFTQSSVARLNNSIAEQRALIPKLRHARNQLENLLQYDDFSTQLNQAQETLQAALHDREQERQKVVAQVEQFFTERFHCSTFSPEFPIDELMTVGSALATHDESLARLFFQRAGFVGALPQPKEEKPRYEAAQLPQLRANFARAIEQQSDIALALRDYVSGTYEALGLVQLKNELNIKNTALSNAEQALQEAKDREESAVMGAAMTGNEAAFLFNDHLEQTSDARLEAEQNVALAKTLQERAQEKFTQGQERFRTNLDTVLTELVGISTTSENVSAEALSLIHQTLLLEHDAALAADFLQRTARHEQDPLRKMWYQLQYYGTRLMSANADEAQQIVTDITAIQQQLTTLNFPPAEQKTHAQEVPTNILNQLTAMSWGTLFDAKMVVYSNVDPSDEDAVLGAERDMDEFMVLRRSLLERRSGEMDEQEASFHADNFARALGYATTRGGAIERALRDEHGGVEAAAKVYAALEQDFAHLENLLAPVTRTVTGDKFFERLAQFETQVKFAGKMSQDLPLDGLLELKRLSGKYAQSATYHQFVASLEGKAPHLFPHADFDPNQPAPENVAELASDRVASAYALGKGSARDNYAPAGAGLACGTLALATMETLVGPMIIAGLCAYGTHRANGAYNVHVLGGNAYQQSLHSGLAQISEREADRNWGTFQIVGGFHAGMSMLFAVPGAVLSTRIAQAGIGLGRWTMQGVLGTAMTALREEGAVAVASKALTGAGQVARAGKDWFFKQSLGSQVRIGAGLAAVGTDYAFLDKNYHLVPWDGKTDTVVGFAGKALLASEFFYRLFRLTWSTRTEGGRIGSGALAEQGPMAWRGLLAHVGADLLAADYYLFNKNYQLNDFADGATNYLDQKLFEKQFTFDNGFLASVGTVLAFGGWGINELRTLPMFIESGSRVFWARARSVVGAGMVAADMVPDGELDTWWLGGLGGALLFNEAGSIALRVDPGGSLVALGFKVFTEYLMQLQQEVPVSDPDPVRLMFASAESMFMRFIAKSIMMGQHYFSGFPLGERMLATHERLKHTAPGLANVFRPVQKIGGEGIFLSPDIAKAKLVPTNKRVSLKLRHDAEGNRLPRPIKVYVLQNKPNKGQIELKNNGDEPTGYQLNALPAEVTALLHANGYFVHEGALYVPQAQYYSFVRIGGHRVTAREIEQWNSNQRAEYLGAQVDKGVWEIRGAGHYYWQEAQSGQAPRIVRRWVTNPNTPKVVSQPRVLDANTAVSNGIHEGEIKLELPVSKNPGGPHVKLAYTQRQKEVASVGVGGKQVMIFTGPQDAPKLKAAGIGINALAQTAAAYGVSWGIFQKGMDGDPNMPKQRALNYTVSEVFTHPFIQWPLGYDTPLAQFAGRSIGVFVNLALNELYPVYLSTWPANRLFFGKLDGKSYQLNDAVEDSFMAHMPWRHGESRKDAFSILANTTTSCSFPNVFDCDFIESRAIANFINAYECWEASLRTGKVVHEEACGTLEPKLASDLEKQVKQEKLTGANDVKLLETRALALAQQIEAHVFGTKHSTLDFRMGLVLLNYLKQRRFQMQSVGGANGTWDYEKLYASWWDLLDRYPRVVRKLPEKVFADGQWQIFIEQVNNGNYDPVMWEINGTHP